jgi:hypothetical protein
MHERWLREVHRVLDPARDPDAGVWLRWRATRYLTDSFARRFERERQAVASLHDHLTGTQAANLWVGGELLTHLIERLQHLAGLCHRATEFSAVALTLLTALEYWCRQVDEALGPVRWGEVSAASRHCFEVITDDPVAQGC